MTFQYAVIYFFFFTLPLCQDKDLYLAGTEFGLLYIAHIYYWPKILYIIFKWLPIVYWFLLKVLKEPENYKRWSFQLKYLEAGVSILLGMFGSTSRRFLEFQCLHWKPAQNKRVSRYVTGNSINIYVIAESYVLIDFILLQGIVLKFNSNQKYATTAITTTILREIAFKSGCPLQVCANGKYYKD